LLQVFVLNCAPQSPLLPTLQTVIHVLFQLYCIVSPSVSLLRFDFNCKYTDTYTYMGD